jgi:hypothetical protein
VSDELLTDFARPALPRPGMTFLEYVAHELGVSAAVADRHLAMMRHLVPVFDEGGNGRTPGAFAEAFTYWCNRRELHLARAMASEDQVASPHYLFLRGRAEEARELARILRAESSMLDQLRVQYEMLAAQEA